MQKQEFCMSQGAQEKGKDWDWDCIGEVHGEQYNQRGGPPPVGQGKRSGQK